jgi:hypothetical protein
VIACAISAGAHAGLIPAHMEEERVMGLAFLVAVNLLVTVGIALAVKPASVAAARCAAVLFAGLIATYVVAVTTGLPGMTDGPETVDAIAVVTKAVEAIGLGAALQLGNPRAAMSRPLIRR